MSWSAKRQFFIIILLFLFFGSIFGVYYYFFIKVPISCTDGKENQGELSVDCGGPCEAICESEIIPLTLKWVRPFRLANGRYDVAAVLVNRNDKLGISKFKYNLSLYDQNNVHIGEKNGETFINPNDEVVVFSPNIFTGDREVSRAMIKYEENLLSQGWSRLNDISSKPKLSVGSVKLLEGSTPSLSGEIINDSPFDLNNIEVSAVVTDVNDNAVAVSSTFISLLKKENSESVVFTWPAPFKNKPKNIDIFPRINYISTQK